jgi:hypothetical protein
MTSLDRLLETHPQKPTTNFDAVAACLSACFECEQACTICADACIGEAHSDMLRQCIRICLDCADVCATTGRLVARQAQPDEKLWRTALEACVQACRSCAAECARHESRHEHCRICREVCERCERACMELMAAYPSGASAAPRH